MLGVEKLDPAGAAQGKGAAVDVGAFEANQRAFQERTNNLAPQVPVGERDGREEPARDTVMGGQLDRARWQRHEPKLAPESAGGKPHKATYDLTRLHALQPVQIVGARPAIRKARNHWDQPEPGHHLRGP
ncbi:hypothetical protein GCM10009628_10580 [Paeniglutamicibacter kerguelensis]